MVPLPWSMTTTLVTEPHCSLSPTIKPCYRGVSAKQAALTIHVENMEHRDSMPPESPGIWEVLGESNGVSRQGPSSHPSGQRHVVLHRSTTWSSPVSGPLKREHAGRGLQAPDHQWCHQSNSILLRAEGIAPHPGPFLHHTSWPLLNPGLEQNGNQRNAMKNVFLYLKIVLQIFIWQTSVSIYFFTYSYLPSCSPTVQNWWLCKEKPSLIWVWNEVLTNGF